MGWFSLARRGRAATALSQQAGMGNLSSQRCLGVSLARWQCQAAAPGRLKVPAQPSPAQPGDASQEFIEAKVKTPWAHLGCPQTLHCRVSVSPRHLKPQFQPFPGCLRAGEGSKSLLWREGKAGRESTRSPFGDVLLFAVEVFSQNHFLLLSRACCNQKCLELFPPNLPKIGLCKGCDADDTQVLGPRHQFLT